MGVAVAALLALVILAAGAALTWVVENRLTVAAQDPGPVHSGVGSSGLSPAHRDSWLYAAAPITALLGVAWAAVVIPLGPGLIPADLTIGLFYFLVVVDYCVLGVAVGGWGANTMHSVEACYRVVAQLIAYVIPLGLAVIGPIMMARSLSIASIVEAQVDAGVWYVLVQPLGFVLYLATALMQSYRAPFLEPFAGRIEYGVLGAYGGWKAKVWTVAIRGLLFVVSAMGALLFLGGWSGPLLPGPIWLLIKTFALMTLMLWIGLRFKPLTSARMLALSWKILIPAGLLNVLLVGSLILAGVGQCPFD